MARKPGQETIYFKKHQVEYFEKNFIKFQTFTQYAVDDKIEEMEMKKKGYVKKYVKEDSHGN